MADPHTLPPPLDGDRNRASETYGTVISITILSTAAVIARMYTRIRILNKVGWDDHTIVLAQVMNLLSFIFQLLMTAKGIGRHMYYLPLQDIVDAGLYYHIVEVLYVLSTATTKVSACLFLMRIMARASSRRLRWALYVMMGILLVMCVGTGIVIIIQCIPVQAGWDPRIKGKCWTYQQALGVGYSQNAWGIVTDLVCSAFPIIVLRKLQISKRNKYALFGIMSLGILSSICCVIKIVHLGDLTQGDFTWNGVSVNTWALLEQNIGVIACCIPALQPLFKSLNERLTHASQSKGKRNSHAMPSWNNSAPNKFGSRSRTFHSIQNNDTQSESEEQILAGDDSKNGIRKTTDVEFFYHNAPAAAPQQAKHKSSNFG